MTAPCSAASSGSPGMMNGPITPATHTTTAATIQATATSTRVHAAGATRRAG